MIYKQISSREETRIAVAESRNLASARDALTRFIEANERRLSAPTAQTVYQIQPRELLPFGFDAGNQPLQFRVMKVADSAGRPYLQGMVISDMRGTTPMRTRHIAQGAGEGAGFIEGGQLYGSFGTRQQPLSMWNTTLRSGGITIETPIVWKTGDYLSRMPGRRADNTMLSDLDMGKNDIISIGMASVSSAHASENLQLDWGEANSVSFAHNISLDKEFRVLGEANVLGNLTSESGELFVNSNTLLGNMAKFRVVETDKLRAQNLVLENVNSPWNFEAEDQSTLSVANHLGLSNGSITAGTVIGGFAGAVGVSAHITGGLLDSTDPSYHWDFWDRSASMQDMQLSNLGNIMRAVIRQEASTPRTEMERTMQPSASNANATVTDYLRALNTAINRVEQKYNSLNLD